MTKKIIIVAGEASGDLHASNLVKSLKQLNPSLEFFGLGGHKMQEAGVKIFYNLLDLAVVGIFEVLKNLSKFKKIFNELLEKIDQLKPDLVILVDYPGFNLRLAKQVKKRNIPIVYYISPQVWAWGKGRINLIKKYVDKMLVIFEFERKFYQDYGIEANFVGHPLLDIVGPKFSKEEFIKNLNLDTNKKIISLLPGSREKEVKTLLPIMLETAKIISRKLPQVQFLILKAAGLDKEIFSQITGKYSGLNLGLIDDQTYDGLNISDFAIVASGTATIETTILEKPMVIVYKVSLLTWLYLRRAVKVPYIGMVNIVRGRKFIPEFIQYDATPQRIATEILSIICDTEKISLIKQQLSEVKNCLGLTGASINAAKQILAFLNQKPITS